MHELFISLRHLHHHFVPPKNVNKLHDIFLSSKVQKEKKSQMPQLLYKLKLLYAIVIFNFFLLLSEGSINTPLFKKKYNFLAIISRSRLYRVNKIVSFKVHYLKVIVADI